jgi:hypothetical protein
MKQPDLVGTEVRHAKRQKRLGADASCFLCGEPQLECLTKTSRGVLERHHVAGRANDGTLTVVLCLNCHRKATERVEAAGVSMGEPSDVLERLVMILRALAEFLHLLADAAIRWAGQLEAYRSEALP